MTETEKYLFEIHGYLVIEGALSPDEMVAANAAIDHHAHRIAIRPNDLAHGAEALRGTTGRGDLDGMLTWDKPHCDVFRRMIAHPRLMPYLEELLGPGFRLEALNVITMGKGAEGFWFHEGGEPYDRFHSFLFRNGRMYCGMTNLAVQLTDVGPGNGGFACLPGSHKANSAYPFNRSHGTLAQWIGLVLENTTRVPWANSRRGTEPTQTAWTTWNGCDSLTDSSAWTAATPAGRRPLHVLGVWRKNVGDGGHYLRSDAYAADRCVRRLAGRLRDGQRGAGHEGRHRRLDGIPRLGEARVQP